MMRRKPLRRRFRRRPGGGVVRQDQARERWKSFEEGYDVHWVGPQVLQRQIGPHRVAIENVLHGVSLEAAFRAKRRARAANFGEVVVEAMAFSRTELRKSDAFGAGKVGLRRINLRSRTAEDTTKSRLWMNLETVFATASEWMVFSVRLYSVFVDIPLGAAADTLGRCLEARVAFMRRGPSGTVTTACDG